MQIIPNHNRVLVKQIVVEQNKTKSGLVLPSTLDREAKTQGKVLKIGLGLQNLVKSGYGYEEGHIVFFGTFAGEKLKVMENGKEEEYVLLTDDEVLGWIE